MRVRLKVCRTRSTLRNLFLWSWISKFFTFVSEKIRHWNRTPLAIPSIFSQINWIPFLGVPLSFLVEGREIRLVKGKAENTPVFKIVQNGLHKTQMLMFPKHEIFGFLVGVVIPFPNIVIDIVPEVF